MLHSQKDIEKCIIGASDGDIGQVQDLYFDDQDWAVRYLIVATGSWLAERKVLISPISIHRPDWSAHRLPATITQEQVKNSPAIETDKPVSRQHEEQYFGYYGYPFYWGGAGMWGAGMDPMGLYPGYAARPGGATLPAGSAAREQAVEANASVERAKHRDDDPHLRSCMAVIGYHILATDGEVGHVEGFLIDDETWAIRYLVVNTSNWWIGHKVLIAPEWIGGVHWSDHTVTVDLSREAVKTALHYDAAADLDRQREAELYQHYDRPPYWQAASTSKD
jgi:sporulation protein YlmC with PRC-barrel domain